MKKFISMLCIIVVILILVSSPVYANLGSNDYDVYTVKRGDSLWKIAVKYEVGLSEIIAANSQFKNPDLIYPGQKVNVPLFTNIKNIEKEVIELTNRERVNNGLKPLKYDWQLSRVARYKSNDMRDKNYFSHTSPTYGAPAKMIKDFGVNYTAMGENIAMGHKTAWSVVNGWMNSSGHRANILNSNFTHIGVGYSISSSGKRYWTQMFIRK